MEGQQMCTWGRRSENNPCELFLSFHVGPVDWTQVLSLGSTHPDSPSHLVGYWGSFSVLGCLAAEMSCQATAHRSLYSSC